MIYVNARFLTQPLTGVQRYAFEVSMQMKSMTDDIVFLTPKNVIQTEWAKLLNAQKIGHLKGHLWEQIELAIYILRQKNAQLFSPCNTGPLCIKNQLLTLHDLAFVVYPKLNSFLFQAWYARLIPRLLQRVQHIFTVSNSMKEEITRAYPISTSKISLTYNGLSQTMQEFAFTKPLLLEKRKLLICVGSLSLRKNVSLLAKAFQQSKLIQDEYTLVFIGSSSSHSKTDIIPVHPQIKVLQDITDKELLEFYQRAEYLICLSTYEGFGIPILEGLAFGCQVLCSKIPAFEELFTGYVSFTSIDKEAEVCDALNRLRVTSQNTIKADRQLFEKFNYQQAAIHILNCMNQK